MQEDVEVAPSKELHDEVAAPVRQRREVGHLHEMRARQAAGEQGLPAKPRDLIVTQPGFEHLDGDLAELEAMVARPINVTDGPAAEVLDELVSPVEFLPDQVFGTVSPRTGLGGLGIVHG